MGCPGSARIPVPLESRRQFGERGIIPSQEGHVTVRAKRYVWAYLFARTSAILGIPDLSFGLRFFGINFRELARVLG